MGTLPTPELPVDRLLTDRDLERMGLAKVRTIKGWRREGRGPKFIKIEHAVRYRLSDVLAYLDSRPGGGRVISKPINRADGGLRP
jgi:hypothetical protein